MTEHPPAAARVRRRSSERAGTIAALCVALLLGACSGEEDLPGPPGGGSGTMTTDNALPLARASLAMTGNLIVVGNIATRMARNYAWLITGDYPSQHAVDIEECADSPAGHDEETNRISYRLIAPGFPIAAGDSLHAAFSNCLIEGVPVNGFMDLAAASVSGDPAGDGPWTFQAEVWLGPLEITHGNGTLTSVTDRMTLVVTHTAGVLTTTLTMPADADRGVIGGLNTQHHIPPLGIATVNYQFRPFEIHTVEDANAGDYTVAVRAGPEGASRLSRYTTSPFVEIDLEVATTAGNPVRWPGGRPAAYTDLPVSGEIRLTEPCNGCGSILATVADDGVDLTIQIGSSVVTEFTDWSTLLAPPDH